MSVIGKSRRWLLGLQNRAWVTTAYRPKAHIPLIWAKLSACDPEPTLLDSFKAGTIAALKSNTRMLVSSGVEYPRSRTSTTILACRVAWIGAFFRRQ
jgi:hypothetical protein